MGIPFPFKKTMIKFAIGRVFDRLDDVIEGQLEKNELIKKIMIEINDNNATLEDVINICVENIKNPKVTKVDDILDRILVISQEVVKDTKELPVKEVISKYLDNIVIPDFDENPDNDISIAAFVLDVISDVALGEKGDEPR